MDTQPPESQQSPESPDAQAKRRSRNAIQRDWATALTAYQAAERAAAALEGQRSLVGRDATIPARAREGASACRAALTDYAR